MDCAQTKRKWHRPWCEDHTYALSWGTVMHQAMVWAKTLTTMVHRSSHLVVMYQGVNVMTHKVKV